MDKYEYKITLEEIKSLVREERYEEAAQIVDGVDWNRVKSADTLCMVSDIYKINGEYEKSRRILQLANTRQPNTPKILYNLCELNIYLYGRDGLQSDLTNALQLMQMYQAVSPQDPKRLILQYKFYNVSPVSMQEKIATLEQLKDEEYSARWGYELAKLQMEAGNTEQAIHECREILSSFGGSYAERAEDLLHELQNGSIVSEPISGEADDYIVDDAPAYKADMPDAGEQDEDAAAEDASYAADQVSQETTPTDLPIRTPEEQAHTDDIRQNVAAGMKDILAKPYEGIVTQETNGQYAMIMDEPKAEEAQIDGQMSISQVMDEWNKIRRGIRNANDRRRTQRLMEDTGTIFAEIEDTARHGLLEDIELGIARPEGYYSIYRDEADAGYDDRYEREYADDSAGQQYADEPAEGQQYEDEHQYTDEPDSMDARDAEASDIAEPAEDIRDTEENKSTVSDDALQDENVAQEASDPGVMGQAATRRWDSEAIRRALQEQQKKAVQEVEREYGQTPEADQAFEDAQPVYGEEEPEPAEEEPASREDESRYADDEPEYRDDARYADEEPEYRDEDARYADGEPEYRDEDTRYADEEPEYRDDARYADEEPEYRDEDARYADDEPDYRAEETRYADDEPDYREEEQRYTDDEPVYPEEETDKESKDSSTEETGGLVVPSPRDGKTVYTEDVIEEEAPLTQTGRMRAEEIARRQREEIRRKRRLEAERALAAQEEEEAAQAPEREQAPEPEEERPVSRRAARKRAQEQTPAKTRPDSHSLTKDEMKLFGPFCRVKENKDQLEAALESISLASYTGNLIITGNEQTADKVAQGILEIIRRGDSNFTGKIAKAPAKALNKLSPEKFAATMDKIENGAMIVEKASTLNAGALESLHHELEGRDHGLIVILIDSKKVMTQFEESNADLLSSFTAKIDIKPLNDKALVEYGKDYAISQDYSLDEFAEMALGSRIASMQTPKHHVTMKEVREIIDEAISYRSRKSLKTLLDIIMRKRYDEEDRIILREKDFTHY